MISGSPHCGPPYANIYPAPRRRLDHVRGQGMTRFVDGPSVEVDVHVEASPGRVWQLVTAISLPARFSQEYRGGEWVEGSDGPARGARFTGRNRHPAIGEWETTSVVVECEPERVFAWAVNGLENPAATWRFELEPQEHGTRLRQSARLGPGPSGSPGRSSASPIKRSASSPAVSTSCGATCSPRLRGSKPSPRRANLVPEQGFGGTYAPKSLFGDAQGSPDASSWEARRG